MLDADGDDADMSLRADDVEPDEDIDSEARWRTERLEREKFIEDCQVSQCMLYIFLLPYRS